MDYITEKSFSGNCLSGFITIPQHAKLTRCGNYLYYFDNKICSCTSETAWEYFYEDTPEGHEKRKMTNALYDYVLKGGEIEHTEEWLSQNTNHYWKNLIRTMPFDMLKETYNKYILGGQAHV